MCSSDLFPSHDTEACHDSEGRPDGVEPMAKVTLLKLKSEEEIQLEIPDAELYQKEINEGNEVAFSPDGVILKLS